MLLLDYTHVYAQPKGKSTTSKMYVLSIRGLKVVPSEFRNFNTFFHEKHTF